MVHTAVVLPRSLLERLKKDAEASERGLSTEIRQRLQASYDLEAGDTSTVDLVQCIKALADELARDLKVQWHKQEFALKAFKAGIEKFLAPYYAEGRAPAEPQFVGHPDDAPPEVVGHWHARRILRNRLQIADPVKPSGSRDT
jgi:hypothetical protein